MRSAALVAVLVGCYQPAALDGTCAIACGPALACPSDRACVGGFCVRDGESCETPSDGPGAVDARMVDGQDGTVPDAPFHACLVPMYAAETAIGTIRTSYTESHDQTPAYISLDGKIVVGTTNVFADATTFVEARLAPTGTELFLSNSTSVSHVFDLGTGWSTPLPVTTTPSNIVPGTVSATNPRHMIAGTPGGGLAYELVESLSDQSWAGPSFLLDGMKSMRDPSLSEDGLRLVFIGILLGNTTTQIYVATRALLGDPFGEPTLLWDSSTAGTLRDPFVPSTDCTFLYYSIDNIEYRAQ